MLMIDRSIPFDLQAERATLGAILLDREAIITVAPWLAPEHFYLEKHAWIYEAAMSCYGRRVPPDIATVSDELRRSERLDLVGGIAFLGELIAEVPTAVHVEYYARSVEQTAVRRRLIETGGKIAALGYEEHEDLETTLDKAEAELFAISQRRSDQDFVHIGQIVNTLFTQIETMQERRGEVVGVPTGYTDLDELTGGLQPSDLIILAARPSVGKCVRWDTLVDDPVSGERLTIEQAVRRRLPAVSGLSAGGHVRPALISEWIDSGMQPCFRVRTRSGRSVDVTGHHPFLAVTGWTPLHDLRAGDRIAVPRALPVFGGDESWPRGLVRLLAYLLAAGELNGAIPAITTGNPLIVADLQRIVAEHFPNCRLRREQNSYLVEQHACRTESGAPSNPLAAWLAELGRPGNCVRESSFPACVWRWTRRYLAEFLRALVSCGGSLEQRNGRSSILFASSAPQLAADLHHAFVRFGLLARLVQSTPGNWQVELSEPASVARYRRQIGWVGPQNACRHRAMRYPARARRSMSGEQRRAMRYAAGVAYAHPFGDAQGRGGAARHPAPTRRSEDGGEAFFPPPNSGAQLHWDAIVSIEPIGVHRVYDLCVPDGANFIAQDICVHNTSLALSMAYNAAYFSNHIVGVFSLEMSREQLVQRILAMHTGIDMQRLRTGQLRGDELSQVMEGMGKLSEIPLYIEDTPGLSITEVRSKARRLHAEAGLNLLMIDYLQLMAGRRTDSRVNEVGEISRGLKALARELEVPVIALSQLSRAVEGRTSHVPMLSDLRESGSIEQDSDIVMFIYREELYDKETDKKGIAEIHIAKHRNGPLGVVPLRFEAHTTRFQNLERYRAPEGY